MKLLKDVIVLDFAQFLAGPSAAMRLSDLGARVIKIERPKGGDAGRQLPLKNLFADGDSLNFQLVNRGKESYAADMKNPEDLERIRHLIAKADVMISNFRPGVMKKLGLDYDAVKTFNDSIIYATVTGYGADGPWSGKPGQDLLAQSMSGITYLTGNANHPPVPLGLSLADSITGTHLVQGILACLVRKAKTNQGGTVAVSLLESMLDLQFESISYYLNSGRVIPTRSAQSNAYNYLGAPYGVYTTSDGYIAVSMGSIPYLGALLSMPVLAQYDTAESCMVHRDEIKALITDVLKTDTTAHWISILEAGNFWCGDVYNWEQMLNSDFFKGLDMLMNIARPGQEREVITSKCPIRVNEEQLGMGSSAPRLGQHTQAINAEFQL